jgi:galactose mutarotase-like enzyme
VDFGGRVEELALAPVSMRDAKNVQQVLLSHNGDAAAIKENTWWKGMFLVPWANRIAYVS